MKLTNINIREKEFHNRLHSKSEIRFENIFYKAIINAWHDFFYYLNLNVKNSEVLDYGCGVGPIMKRSLNLIQKITGIDISDVSISKQKKDSKITILLSYWLIIVNKQSLKTKNLI